MTARRILVSAAALWLAMATASVASADITPFGGEPTLQNFSFETGDFTAWVHSGLSVRHAGDGNATDGSYYAASDPNRDATLSQAFTMPEGTTELAFDAAYGLVNVDFSARLYAIGDEEHAINLLGGVNRGLGWFDSRYWSRITTDVSPLAGQDVIIEFSIGKSVTNPPVVIDNIQFPSPEPATMILLAAGGACLAARRGGRRRR
jgi:hypothetical protein